MNAVFLITSRKKNLSFHGSRDSVDPDVLLQEQGQGSSGQGAGGCSTESEKKSGKRHE
jgi:hypothetical protein